MNPRTRHSTPVSLLALIALLSAMFTPASMTSVRAQPAGGAAPAVRVFSDTVLSAAGVTATAAPAQAAAAILAAQTAGPLAAAAGLDWQVSGGEALSDTRSVVRLQQSIGGWPVFGAELALQVEAGRVRSAAGAYVPAPQQTDKPLVTAEAARRIALEYLRSNPPAHSDINPADDDRHVDARYADAKAGRAQLVYFEPTLFDLATPLRGAAYRVLVETADGGEAASVLVDGRTGKVVLSYSEWHSALNRTVRDANNVETLGGTVCATEGSVNASASADCRAAYTNTGRTYTYFRDAHGRDSFDNNGAAMIAVIRYGTMPNAFWNGSLTAYGPGFAMLDVVAHEWTHAVTQYTAGLIYYGQSGALNESFSDIFGAMVDGDDWLMGEETPIGAIRSLANPPLYDQPDRMSDYYCMSGDNGGVHYNSGVPNKLAYLLAQGGTFNGVAVTAIGRPDTAAIFYRTLIGSLTPSATFNQTAAALISSAESLFGATSTQAVATRAAVNAVELDEAWPCGGAAATPDSYEVDDSVAEATPIVPGGSAATGHNFHDNGDVDYHVFSAVAGTSYVVETSGLGFAADTVLALYAADGRTLLAMDDDGGTGLASRINYTAGSSGTLYIAVANYGDVGGNGTGYTVAVTSSAIVSSPDGYEPDNSRSAAGRLVVNAAVQSRNFHVAGDEDWFVFAVEAGRQYRISAADSGARSDTLLELYSADGTLLADNDAQSDGTGAAIDWVAAGDGDLYGRVRHYRDLFGSDTAYRLGVSVSAVSAGDAYEPDDSSADATLLEAGTDAEQTHSFHQPGDVDWLRLDLAAQTGYVLATDQLASSADTVIELYNSSLQLIDENDDSNGLASRLLIAVGNQPATYYARIRNYSSAVGRPEMTYVVRLLQDDAPLEVDAQEPDDTAATARVLTAGTSDAPTQLSYNFHQREDKDWIRFSATAGTTYRFESSGLEAYADTVFTLFGADGSELFAYDDDGGDGYGSLIVWQAPADGDYTLQIRNYFWANAGANTGYTLSFSATDGVVDDGDSFEPDDSAAQAAVLEVNGAGAAHTLHTAADRDWAVFSATEGQTYELLTDELLPPADTVLELYAPDGTTLLARNDDVSGGNLASRITWQAPADGEYYLQVLPYAARNTGADSGYRLRAMTIGDAYEPDGTAELATAIVPDGATQQHDLTQGDDDWLVFPAESGTLYQVTTSQLGSCSDTVLDLYEAGNLADPVAWNDDYSGLASQINWTAQSDGELYVRVRHFSTARSHDCSDYTIAVTTSSAAVGDSFEPDNTTAAAATLTVGTDQARSIHQAGDVDWVQFSAEAGTRYVFETTALAACTDTVLTLTTADGTVLDVHDDVGWPDLRSRITWTAPSAMTVFLQVRDYWASAGSADCTYVLRATVTAAFGPDAYEDDDSAATLTHSLPADGAAESRTFDTARDEDWMLLTTTAGRQYTIWTEDLGATADTVLSLYRLNSNGTRTLLTANDDDWNLPDNFASRISFTAAAGEQYALLVQPWLSSGGREGATYRLRASSATALQPTAPATTAATDGRLQLTGLATEGAARIGGDVSVVVSAQGAADAFKLLIDDKQRSVELVAVEPLGSDGQVLRSAAGAWSLAETEHGLQLAVNAPRSGAERAPLLRLRLRILNSVDGKHVRLPIQLTAAAADGSSWAAGSQVISLPLAGDIKIDEVSPSEVTLDGDAELLLRVSGLGGQTPKVYLVDTLSQAVQQVSGVSLVEGSPELVRLVLDSSIKSGRYKVRVTLGNETELSSDTLRLNAPDYRLFIPGADR